MTKREHYEKACKWLSEQFPEMKDKIDLLLKRLLILNSEDLDKEIL